MKKLLTIVLVFTALHAFSINFDEYFENRTLRIDYFHAGNFNTEEYFIDEIKAEYLEGLTFHYVKEMSEVLALALTDQSVKNAKVLK